ncbi:EpsG family protein [Elizabethkingia meningoseptica]|uniref:EpsG family protein n=1 Tax=Elizabethkingia meningoseptica TaxID=238 RepID=UPI003018EC45
MDIIILFAFVLICFLSISIEKRIQRSFSTILISILFCFIIATRNSHVPDTDGYIIYFNLEDSDLKNISNVVSYEIGFRFLTKILKNITENVQLYFAVITLLNLILINFSSKIIIKNYNYFVEKSQDNKSKIFFISSLILLLYVAFYGIYLNAIILRAGIAFSFVFLSSSLALIPKKNLHHYLLIVVSLFIAYLFHSTAALGIIIVFILLFSKQFSRQWYISLLIITFFVYTFNIFSSLGIYIFSNIGGLLGGFSELSTKLGSYSTGYGAFSADGFSLKFLFFLVMGFILSFNVSVKENILYYKLLNVYCIGIFIAGLFRSVVLVERITDYFIFFSFILFYLFLIKRKTILFWGYLILIVTIQMIFVLRITNKDLIF